MTGSRWWQVLLRLKEGQTQSQVGGLDNCRPRSKTLLICLCIRQTFQCAGVLIPWCTYSILDTFQYRIFWCTLCTLRSTPGTWCAPLYYCTGHLGSSGLCVGRHLRAFPIFNCFHNYCTLFHTMLVLLGDVLTAVLLNVPNQISLCVDWRRLPRWFCWCSAVVVVIIVIVVINVIVIIVVVNGFLVDWQRVPWLVDVGPNHQPLVAELIAKHQLCTPSTSLNYHPARWSLSCWYFDFLVDRMSTILAIENFYVMSVLTVLQYTAVYFCHIVEYPR